MRHWSNNWIQSALIVTVVALSRPGEAQGPDLCGCAGNPESLGAFDTKDEASWASIGGVLEGNSITLPLPEDGVLIFDSFAVDDLPGGGNATLRFAPNQANTPVTILVSGDVLVGPGDVIDLRGQSGQDAAENVAGRGGLGGPGGHKGGDGGFLAGSLSGLGGEGLGPGGGDPGTPAETNVCPGNGICGRAAGGFPGTWVGAGDLLPVTGGGGGGGGSSASGSTTAACSGGGGGGGAILLVSNGTVTIHGTINARGGANGYEAPNGCPTTTNCRTAPGGPGAGGSIRLVASVIAGSGFLDARGGGNALWTGTSPYLTVGPGGDGEIRLEAFTIEPGIADGSPVPVQTLSPGVLSLGIAPSVAITAVAGAGVLQPPGGWQGSLGPVDVFVATAGPTDVEVATSGVPAGTGVDVVVKPRVGGPGVVTTALVDAGTCDSLGHCVATASVNLDPGRYVIEAEATFQTP